MLTIRPISLGRLTKVLGYSDIPHSRFAIFKLWICKFYNVDRSQLVFALERTVLCATVNEKQNERNSLNHKKPQLVSTGRLTDTEKYLTFRLLRSLSDSSTTLLLERQRACFVGKTQTPLSLRTRSSANRSVYASSEKCSEHTAECSLGSQCARFDFTKSIHFLLRLCFSESVYRKKVWDEALSLSLCFEHCYNQKQLISRAYCFDPDQLRSKSQHAATCE